MSYQPLTYITPQAGGPWGDKNPLFPLISILSSVRAWIVVWCRRKFKVKMEIENIDFFNVDANWDPDIDDMTLSQPI
jgi:hypothetical protein